MNFYSNGVGLKEVLRTNGQFVESKGLGRVAASALFLGFVAASGLAMAVFWSRFWSFGAYLTCLAVFHSLEFFLTALFHPLSVSNDGEWAEKCDGVEWSAER